jgi:hypothetical protein
LKNLRSEALDDLRKAMDDVKLEVKKKGRERDELKWIWKGL